MTISAWSQMSNSRFIAADEFSGRDVTLTIKDAWTEDMTDFDGEPAKAGIVSFVETERQWRVNSTNRARLQTIWPKPQDAIGRMVTLMASPESKSPSGVAVRVKGSPDLPGPTVTLDPIGMGKSRKFTLVKTEARTTAPPEPKPDHDAPAPVSPSSGPLTLRCTGCGATIPASVDATADDLVGICCDKCGADMAVAS